MRAQKGNRKFLSSQATIQPSDSASTYIYLPWIVVTLHTLQFYIPV